MNKRKKGAGKITHEELMAQAGRYQDLWNNYTTALNWKFGAGREA